MNEGACLPSKLPLTMGIWTPSVRGFLGPAKSASQTASRSVQPFCAGQGRLSLIPILDKGVPFSLKNCPFPWEDLDTHLIHDFLGQSKSTIQTASRSVRPFLHSSPSVPIGLLYNGPPFPLKNAPYTHEESGSQSNTWMMVP